MKYLHLIVIIIALLAQIPTTYSQEAEKPKVSFSGFVRHDIVFDSRQTLAAREGYFLFYPLEIKPDATGKDINAKPTFNMLAIQSTLAANISETSAFGAKVSGLVEADFFGQSNTDVNGLRLRHAYMLMKWKKTELMMGQYWHPLFVVDNNPSVISPNAGSPFNPFSRSPQLRFIYNHNALRFLAVVSTQRDYTSKGPQGDASIYLRNSALPDFNFQIHYKSPGSNLRHTWLAGAGVGYKQLSPRLATALNHKSTEKVQGMSAMAFLKLTHSKYTLRASTLYGQNLADLLMIGGYAVRDVTANPGGNLEYSTINNFTTWVSASTNGTKLQAGIFIAYSENIGSQNKIKDYLSQASYWYRGENIAYLYRVAPRFSIVSGKFRIGSEIEYTSAAYGNSYNEFGKILNAKEVANLRFLVSTFYNF